MQFELVTKNLDKMKEITSCIAPGIKLIHREIFTSITVKPCIKKSYLSVSSSHFFHPKKYFYNDISIVLYDEVF